MKLNWESNNRYNQDISMATTFTLNEPFRITIHKYIGCGNQLYVSCPALNINTKELYTENLDEAEKRALETVNDYAKILYNKSKELLDKIK